MVNISSANAKNNFSDVLKQVQNGESFVIEYGRKQKKIAKIIPYQETKIQPIKIGLYKDNEAFDFKIHDDWEMTTEELLDLE
ncbi:hypothetical protein BROOK1789C_399 [Bathymodiolus brooksi thiotrophic gill symbiont]|jgi:antitoxin (DNA-binding transcriptional repressor) of toxin-antitoxin stability system|nr:hypothetical protein BROOK1789B_206 [Bathymodiolus brooksi thiotrophic gill symbiont]CAB9542673.1 hypothetical protein BROOK1789C_399 [Bathymodiolus brooksi thiotrophic gill symbiont]SHE19746.1 hypothetical protein BBROOKSOX_1611 [Bathymodiolus brooksi thiotrophic gill symbiont]